MPPGNEVHGDMGMQMGRRQAVAAEPAAAEPAAAEPAAAEPSVAEYPGASDLLNLLATGGPGKRIFTDEELHFYSKAIRIYTDDTVKALDLLFPIVSNTHGVTIGERPPLTYGFVGKLPDIKFYKNEKRADGQDILQRLVNIMEDPPHAEFANDLKEVAQNLINGVKRKNGEREGIADDIIMFILIKEKIVEEIPDDARRREIIQKIDNALGFADTLNTKLQEYASSRVPWSTELHGFMGVGGNPDHRSMPDIPFALRVPISEGNFQPPESQTPVRHSPATTSGIHGPQVVRMAGTGTHGPQVVGMAEPVRMAGTGIHGPQVVRMARYAHVAGTGNQGEGAQGGTEQPATLNFDRQLEPEPELETQAPGRPSGLSSVTDVFSGITSGAMAKIGQARDAILGEPETMGPSRGRIPNLSIDQRPFWQRLTKGPSSFGGGKRKRKYKRTRKTHKHSKHKKSHKRKKTLKRKYKNKSKRR
jgi:hypothetical protein